VGLPRGHAEERLQRACAVADLERHRPTSPRMRSAAA
jgi:hypothetical protein